MKEGFSGNRHIIENNKYNVAERYIVWENRKMISGADWEITLLISGRTKKGGDI